MASLIDTRAYGKLRDFSGLEDEWVIWSSVARSYFSNMSPDMEARIEHAEVCDRGSLGPINYSPDAQAYSRTLYHILNMTVLGNASVSIQSADREWFPSMADTGR